MLHKLTKLVGGPLAGQEFDESFFDGRAHINVWPKPETPSHDATNPEPEQKLPDRLTEGNMQTYYLILGTLDDESNFALFTFPGLDMAEIQAAASQQISESAPKTE